MPSSCFRVLALISEPLDNIIPTLNVQMQTLERLRMHNHGGGDQQEIPHKLLEMETVADDIRVLLRRFKHAFAKPDSIKMILGRLNTLITEVLKTVFKCI